MNIKEDVRRWLRLIRVSDERMGKEINKIIVKLLGCKNRIIVGHISLSDKKKKYSADSG